MTPAESWIPFPRFLRYAHDACFLVNSGRTGNEPHLAVSRLTNCTYSIFCSRLSLCCGALPRVLNVTDDGAIKVASCASVPFPEGPHKCWKQCSSSAELGSCCCSTLFASMRKNSSRSRIMSALVGMTDSDVGEQCPSKVEHLCIRHSALPLSRPWPPEARASPPSYAVCRSALDTGDWRTLDTMPALSRAVD
jgi:hypothetical protein